MIGLDVEAFMRAANLTAPRAAYWWPHVQQALLAYGIVRRSQVAAFLAHASHESVRFTSVVENLNYTSHRLTEVFRVFREGRANPREYEFQPEKTANFVYSYRNGNGAVESGDGWRYRGRGLFQITGRGNYEKMGEQLLLPLLDAPELLEQPEWAAMSAAAYWNLSGCDKTDDVDAQTRLINGPAMLGLAERQFAFERAYAVLA